MLRLKKKKNTTIRLGNRQHGNNIIPKCSNTGKMSNQCYSTMLSPASVLHLTPVTDLRESYRIDNFVFQNVTGQKSVLSSALSPYLKPTLLKPLQHKSPW